MLRAQLVDLPATMLDASILRKKPRTARQIAAAMRPKEHDVQAAFITWLRWEETVYQVLKLGFAVPNGGKRAMKTAVTLKQEGQRPGVPDWMLPAPRQGRSGLAIEFKRPGEGREKALSDEQIDYRDRLVAEGWQYHVIDDFEDAIKITKHYLGIR